MNQNSELVVIVILNLNKREDILKCLESVFKLDYSPYEVVVVDNGSMDGSVEAISKTFPRAHLIRGTDNAGVAGGRNLGIDYADSNFQYQYLMFLDNDTSVDKGLLGELIRGIQRDDQTGIATPKSYRMSLPGIVASAGGININLYTGSIYDIGSGEVDKGQYDKPSYVPSCAGYAFLVRKEVLRQIGQFDESFNPYGWEDVDFSLRARKKGFKILYVPQARIYHKGGKAGRGALPEYEKHKVRNFFVLMRRHTNKLQWTCFVCLVPVRAIFFMKRELFRGNFRIISAQLRGFFR